MIDLNIYAEINATAAKMKGVTYKYLLKNWSSDNETALRTIIFMMQLKNQDVCDETAGRFSTSVSTLLGGKIVVSQQVIVYSRQSFMDAVPMTKRRDIPLALREFAQEIVVLTSMIMD